MPIGIAMAVWKGKRMPIGKLNQKDRQRLSDHFWPIVLKACVEHDCWPGEVLNSLKKSRGIKGISPARAEIVKRMQATVYTYYGGAGQCNLLLFSEETQRKCMPEKARPISLAFLARALGCDHSTLVRAQQRLQKQKQENDHGATIS